MHFIHSTISIRRYMSVNCVRVRPDALAATGNLYGPATCCQLTSPRLRGQLCAAPSCASAARAAPRANCAGLPLLSGARCCTEVRRSRFGTRTISGLNSGLSTGSTGDGGPEPRLPGERARLCLPRSVCQACQVRRNVDIVVHLFNQHFLLLHSGEEG
jgi:hypothetical protein